MDRPAYYAQVMFSSCLGDHTVESSVSGAGDKFFYSATASANSKVCVKLVNAASTDQPITITLAVSVGELMPPSWIP